MPEESSPQKDRADTLPVSSRLFERVLRVNRTWITRGGLAVTTEKYLKHLASTRQEVLEVVCERALAAAQNSSKNQIDPKPSFYASLFSEATKKERDQFLKNHFFTRLLSAELQSEQTRSSS